MNEPVKEMNAVVGFLSDAVAQRLGGKAPSEPLEIRLGELGGPDTLVRIQPGDVAGMWTGPSKGGQTGVQVLLKENATVETFTRGNVADFLRPIKDGSITPFRPPITVIYIPPFMAEKLGV